MSARSSARLTDARIRNAKRADKAYKLSDGAGLHLAVQPTGTKCWRYRYRIDGRENLFALGEYPEISLQQARAKRDVARELVKRGIHPAAHRRAQRLVVSQQAADTFEAVAKEWIEQNRESWSKYYLSQAENVLAADVYPDIGRLPIRAVQAVHLLAILKRVEKRGAPTVAILIRQWTSAIFRYAVVTLRADHDPAAALKGAVTKPRTKHKRALSQSELPVLVKRVASSRSGAPVKIALQLLLMTFVRPKELREARWAEFDLDRALWEIPDQRMKRGIAHVVPLSRQAVQLLLTLRKITGNRPLLFPNQRDPRRPMSATTLNRCLERMGYAGYFSAHGFRATASTYFNSAGWRKDAVERQLSHQEGNKVRASYNHAEYLPERTKMMQAWADYLDALLVDGKVVPIRSGLQQIAS
ncbi:tyrosine-type recombinase/integrase [Pseudoxanthomonas mexicana]|uniref:tyrosine-type recombinase/integrase n=1 Tax=Pseudoxanthomonas mexicana TaxID=128785 RepID=UPI0022F3A3DF|nr:integrase arm-type DNA-binding domain-containing protein [Pseudoxanthomonas mexicana]WBX94275.1 integrase arm-type DNA-binding domain-containing protein [Pseudoxanthomonas mexicana]